MNIRTLNTEPQLCIFSMLSLLSTSCMETFAKKLYLSNGIWERYERMVGDSKAFGAIAVRKENENNRIGDLFSDEKENYPSFFGFIVEE